MDCCCLVELILTQGCNSIWASKEGFSCKNFLESWAKIGAAPLTHMYLKDPQVRKSMDMAKDYAFLVNSVQEANDYAVYALTKGDMMGRLCKCWLQSSRPMIAWEGQLPSKCCGSRLNCWLMRTLMGRSSLQWAGAMCVWMNFLKLKHFR